MKVLGIMDIFKFGTSEYATPVGILIKAGTDPSLIQPGVTEITLLPCTICVMFSPLKCNLIGDY